MIEIKTIASGSSGNAYRISDGKTCILLECGIAFKKIQQAISFKVSGLSACLISHSHGDHALAVRSMVRAGINCYMSKYTAEELNLKQNGYVKTIAALEQFTVGSFTTMGFPLVHDVSIMGFLIASGKEKICFITDSAYCKYKFNGLTHILIECNYQDSILQENIDNGIVEYGMKKRLLETHMSLNQTLGFLKANDLTHVQEIHLIHLSDRNSDAEMMRRAVIRETGKPVFINNNLT